MYNAIMMIGAAMLVVMAGCVKDPLHHRDYCDNLVTDTLGTGDSCRIYVPYAFTPNGDGINEVFMPAAFNAASWLLEIYDDCGEMIYSNSTLGAGWHAQPGMNNVKTYHYRLQVFTEQHHHIGQCGELVALQCIPHGFRMDQFTFSDQIGYDGFQYATSEMIGSCP